MKLKRPEITISDHAIVRYIERRYGLNLDAIRKEIIDTVAGPVSMGAASHSVGDVTFMFKDHPADKTTLVTTVLYRNMARNGHPNQNGGRA